MDPALAERLRARMGTSVEVVEGDAARMPFGDGRFSVVVCFTMLHHVPSVRQQDDLLREAKRVLRPGGVFAGLDSLPRWKVRLIHLFDTMVPVDPATFPSRLDRAGFQGATVDAERTRFRVRAYAPGPP